MTVRGSNPSSTRARPRPLETAYIIVGDIAERCVELEHHVADLDDDQLSIDLNELQQAVLQIPLAVNTRRLPGHGKRSNSPSESTHERRP